MQDANLVTTKKIYEEDAYRTIFSAKVLSYDDTKGDLVLDATLFFPEEGGQGADHGVIAGHPVTDVQIEGDAIHHYFAEPYPAKEELKRGTVVSGEIDFSRRFSNMQQHSGEHLFSGAAKRLFKANNVGFHLGEQEVTLDFDLPLTQEQLIAIECEVNALIVQNIPSEVFRVEGLEKKRLEYRSKLDLEGPVRIVRFGEADVCACCAPHVRQTGEIGLLKVISTQKWKDGVRITILCGARAMGRLSQEHAILMGVAEDLSTSWQNVREITRQQSEQQSMMATHLRSVEETLIGQQIEAQKTPDDVLLFLANADGKAMRDAINTHLPKHRLIALFDGDDAVGYHYIIASDQSDVQALQDAMKNELAARGGGRSPMIEGRIPAKETEIRDFFAAVRMGA